MNTKNFKYVLAILIFILNVATSNANVKTLNLTIDNKPLIYTGPFINLFINDNPIIDLPLEPIILDDRTLIPAREIFEGLGASVLWVEETRQIIVSYENDSVLLQINNNEAIVNGETVYLDVPPKIIYNKETDLAKTMIPIRFVSENLGFNVHWDGDTYTVKVDNFPLVEPIPPITPDIDEPIENLSPAIDVSVFVIEDMDFPVAKINNVFLPIENVNYFSIFSNSEISKVDYFLLPDNRLVVDIYNSILLDVLIDENISGDNFLEFRISQFELTPLPITRAVFKLDENTNYYVDLSKDRRRLDIGFSENLPIIDDITPIIETDDEQTFALDISTDIIESETHIKTNINKILLPDLNNNFLSIHSTSKISGVKKTLLPDNRLIIDIYNSEPTVPTSLDVPIGLPFTEVRISQFETTPELITRVVLQLNSNTSFFTSINNERTQIQIGFEKNTIYDVVHSTNGVSDTLTIKSSISPIVNYKIFQTPKFLQLTLPASSLTNDFFEPVPGIFIHSITASNVNGNVQLTLPLLDDVSVDIVQNQNSNSTVITLFSTSFRNVYYESDVISIKKDDNLFFNINDFEHIDNYNNNEYILNTYTDFEPFIGSGTFEVNDNLIESFNISHSDFGTSFKFKTNSFIVPIITEDDDYLYFTIKTPKDVYDKIVVLDPGHGGKDEGASGYGIIEKNINLDIALKTKNILESNSNIKVYMTRDDDSFSPLDNIVEFANEVGDLFVSIHNNSSYRSAPNGIETYFFTHSNDNELGFSSEYFANIAHNNLLATLQANDRKVKEAKFVVIRYTEIPAVLLEVGFISNFDEATKLATDEYRSLASVAIFNSIVDAFNIYTPRR